MTVHSGWHGSFKTVALMMVFGNLTGCVHEWHPRPVQSTEVPDVGSVMQYESLHVPPPSAVTEGRDAASCAAWATEQTGFDPAGLDVPSHLRTTAQALSASPASMQEKAAAAATRRAREAYPWYQGDGTPLRTQNDTASLATRDADVRRIMTQYGVSAEQARRANYELTAANYSRAIAACFEARGYSVKIPSV